MLKQSSGQSSVEADAHVDESDQNDHISMEGDAHVDESDQNDHISMEGDAHVDESDQNNNIVLFYVLFTKLEDIAHYKAKNTNTVKTNFCQHASCMPATSNRHSDWHDTHSGCQPVTDTLTDMTLTQAVNQ